MRILIVLTSHDQLGDTEIKTGFWLEEFATPYYVFKDANATITLASPKGGRPPLDPESIKPDAQTKATRRYDSDIEAQAAVNSTARLADLSADDFDAVFYPGGHGPLFDLAEDSDSIALIEALVRAGKPVAAVCHAPGVFRHTKDGNGAPLVKGKSVTSFSNAEEDAIELSDVLPFLVEDELKAQGGIYTCVDNFQAHTVIDGALITGQNPASSRSAAQAILDFKPL